MEPNQQSGVIPGDELAEALGVEASSALIGQLGMLVWPVKKAQGEAFMLMDERAAILADAKLMPQERAHKVQAIETALQRIVMDAVALTAHYSIPHLSLTILSASAAKGTLSAGALKDFLARTDRWSGSFLPETRADWATALGMPAGSSQKQVLARIVELGTARKERERDRYLTDQVATFAVNELRICVASRRGMEIKGHSASQAALFLTCLATELREFLALARPRPVLLATAKGFRITEPLVLLTAADGKWHIEQ